MEIEQANRKSIHTNKEVKEKMLELYKKIINQGKYSANPFPNKINRVGRVSEA